VKDEGKVIYIRGQNSPEVEDTDISPFTLPCAGEVSATAELATDT
jgi:hypothetical protein